MIVRTSREVERPHAGALSTSWSAREPEKKEKTPAVREELGPQKCDRVSGIDAQDADRLPTPAGNTEDSGLARRNLREEDRPVATPRPEPGDRGRAELLRGAARGRDLLHLPVGKEGDEAAVGLPEVRARADSSFDLGEFLGVEGAEEEAPSAVGDRFDDAARAVG